MPGCPGWDVALSSVAGRRWQPPQGLAVARPGRHAEQPPGRPHHSLASRLRRRWLSATFLATGPPHHPTIRASAALPSTRVPARETTP